MAFRAGDGDFSLPPGDTNHLTALGAVVIAVLPVLQAVKKLQEFAVFLIPLVGIAGKGAEHSPEHTDIGQGRKDQGGEGGADDQRNQAENDAQGQNQHIELVCSVAAIHKMPQGE